MLESRQNRGMTLEFSIRLCRELERENARLRERLEQIASYDETSPHGEGCCDYGCDAPGIARDALENDPGHRPATD